MKTTNFISKLICTIILLFAVFLYSTGLLAQTITSTTSGGLWNSTTTWSGGAVPSAASNVVINGPVRANGDFTCNNLTINASCSLMNEYGYNATIAVSGVLTNNGSITKNPSGYSFYMNLLGNLENNGNWSPTSTKFSGSGDQRIKQSSGKKFEGYFLTTDASGDIILDSNVTFDSNTWDWSKSTLKTNGFTFTALNYQLNNGFIISNDKLVLSNTGISTMIFDGNYSIDGKVHVQSSNVFNGTVTVLDTLMNRYGYNSTLTINGKIINNGKIIKNPAGYSFHFDLMSDVENNGVWNLSQTNFAGTGDQKIKQTAGKSFQGYFLTTDTLGQIILESDVTFDGNTWDCSKSKMQTNGNSLNTVNYQLNNGTIISNDKLVLKNSGISEMTFSGDYSIDGKVHVQSGNVFNGTATILDTLMNRYGYNSTLTVNGKIINNGKIIKNPAGYSFYLNIFSDLENNGVWAPSQTSFSGKTDQKIKQTAEKIFQGYFLTTDTLGQIILESDVIFDGNTWDWNKSKLQTNGNSLNTVNYQLNNGTIISNDKLVLKNSGISEMTFSGDYSIDGKVHVQTGNVFNGTVTILDTLMNRYGYNSTLTVNGKIINNGTIIKNPGGYSFYLSLLNNVENNGLWAPSQTTFAGKTDQILKQSPDKKFQGYFLNTDTIGKIIFESDILFESNTWDMAKRRVLTNKFNLHTKDFLFNNGIFQTNDTLDLRNSAISNVTVEGDFKIAGKVNIRVDNVFKGKVTVLDTMQNQYGYNSYLTVSGELINNGIIANNPQGYSLSVIISGSLFNNQNLSVANIYLYGTGDRTIAGKNAKATSANFIVDDAVSLVNENILPSLNFSNNPNSGLTVKPGAVLMLLSLNNAAKVKNYGRISYSQDIDNTTSTTYNFYMATVNTKSKSPVGKLVVDNYGYQQHPTATGTINTWWRLRNSPQLFNDSLNWLRLSYFEDALNGNTEDSIKVFHSPNAGLTWKRVRTGITIDKTNNLVSISNAPSFGHYLLSSSGLGITSFEPLVESAEPRFGGNTGQLSMYLFGAGFKTTSTVTLKASGQTNIKADTTLLTDAIGESMLARFDLKNKPLGVYDVIIETPGEKTLTLPAYFTIMKGERSDPWSTISGRDRFLIHRWQTFNIGFGNTANTDALGTILVFVINDLPGLEIDFPDINVVLPKPIVEMGPDFTRFAELGLYYTSESLSGYENEKMRVYPFYIPYIAAGSAQSTRVKIRLNGQGSLKMDSWILDPLFEKIDYNLKAAEPMPAEVRACITAAAMKAWYNGALNLAEGMIPGVACWGVIDKTVDPIGYITPEELKPEGKDTWGSWFWNGVSIMGSAVQCGASFVPGLGQAVNLGIGLVNMGIDMKDGYDATQGCWNKFRKKSQNKLNSRGVTSFDPNEKMGPQGYTSEHFISKEGNMNYTIFFENKNTAGAAALEVFITDTLDKQKFDFSTFSFSKVTFGDTVVKIQDYAREFKVLVDLYPKKNIIVQIHGKLDTLTGVVSWNFHSLDRITLELTEDPDGGFLPPNKISPEGEGNVTFSCKLKNSVAHGDVISNKASIIFDFNEPIITNTFTNTIDDRVPVSSVAPLPITLNDSIINISWSGSDYGSQISKYNIFVSTNDSTYVLWKVASGEGNAIYKGKDGFKYKFMSIATDSLGFAENMKTTPDASVNIDFNTSAEIVFASDDVFKLYPNPAKQVCNVIFKLNEESKIEIVLTDVSGKMLMMNNAKKYQAGHQQVELNLNGISDGIYIVKCSVNQKTYFGKLIVRK
jgi:hypothetical protein